MFDLKSKVDESIQNRITTFTARSNYASQIGDSCLRKLVLNRTAGDFKKPHNVFLERIFERGRTVEEIAVQQIKKAGFIWQEQQSKFEDRKSGIAGAIDGMVGEPNGSQRPDLFPCEIKTINPYDWEKINSVEDMKNSTKHWVRGYPAQLQIYLFLKSAERGLWWLVNALTWEGKDIWTELDIDFVDSLLKKGKEINDYVDNIQEDMKSGMKVTDEMFNDHLPDRIPYDSKMCDSCAFEHLCLPAIHAKEGAEFVEDPELEEKLNRREELRAVHSEYSRIDKEVKKQLKLKDGEKRVVGDFLIQGSKVERKAYPVKAGSYIKLKIEKLKGV